MHQRIPVWTFTAMLVLLSAGPLQAGTVMVGPGAGLDTGAGQLNLGCNDLTVAGDFGGHVVGAGNVSVLGGGSLNTDQLSFSADWQNAGQAEVPGSVQWLDGCDALDVQMTGVTEFSTLEISTNNGRAVRLQANATQQVTGALTLQGAPGALLTLRSTMPGQFAGLSLAPQGSQSIAFVDVADIDSSDGQLMAPGSAELSNSVDSGNNLNWFREFASAIPVPTLGLTGAMLLIFMFVLMSVGRFRHARSSMRG